MPLQVIETQRLYQQVAHQLRELIRSGEYRPGNRLPPERDLARQLGISRPTVREAMIALEIQGLIEIRVGSGIFVLPAPSAASPEDPGPSPHEVLGARRLVEAEIAAAAAAHARPDQLCAIQAALDDMAQDIAAGGHGLAGDRQFHVQIAAATGNSVLVGLVESLWDGRESLIFTLLGVHTQLLQAKAMTLADHRRIFGCISRRDPEAARSAMAEHLDHVRAILEGTPELVAPTPALRKSADAP